MTPRSRDGLHLGVAAMIMFGLAATARGAGTTSTAPRGAQGGPTHAITRAHIGAGGGRSSSNGPGAYQVTGTIAQPAPGYASGGGHQLDAGFWHADRPELILSDGFEDSAQ